MPVAVTSLKYGDDVMLQCAVGGGGESRATFCGLYGTVQEAITKTSGGREVGFLDDSPNDDWGDYQVAVFHQGTDSHDNRQMMLVRVDQGGRMSDDDDCTIEIVRRIFPA